MNNSSAGQKLKAKAVLARGFCLYFCLRERPANEQGIAKQ